MASRRDELNAYNFSRKRTVASFLKPLPNGSVESAPRPLKHAISGIVMSVVILAGFGACGMLSPVAPKGWDTPEAGIIVTDPSATRYVVLNSGEKDKKTGKDIPVLHPVLNLASAKLLLDPKKTKEGSVKTVKEKFLDESNIAQGSMVGIPYAPDRLPNVKDAGTSKVWALCQKGIRDSKDSASVQQTVLVLNTKDAKKVTDKGSGKLAGDQALYVQDKKGKPYLVSSHGVRYELRASNGGDLASLIRTLFGDGAEPRTVTDEWLSTLRDGQQAIAMPSVANDGQTSQADGVPAKYRTTGTLLRTRNGQHYLVEQDRLIPITGFQTALLRETIANSHITTVNQTDIGPDTTGKLAGGELWPTQAVSLANGGQTDTSCSVYGGGNSTTDLTTWAGTSLPVKSIAASASSYVSPGSGLLYQEKEGSSDTGFNYLVTDTGLRYYLPVNNDSGDDKSGDDQSEVNKAKIRLGYESAQKVTVPSQWSKLLPSGPNLTTAAAQQTQNS
ncbi:type VII secretion protein EccB [Streptomyces sp. NPDC057694]|uniref:type VII secretion protein EccB n=1 Tax=Streptomyces sp. NPDC057694 TaxID=3346216 RepID=UPI0036B701B1